MDFAACIAAIRAGTARLVASFTLVRPFVRAEAVYYQFPEPRQVDASRWPALGFVVVNYAGRQSVEIVRSYETPESAGWRGVW